MSRYAILITIVGDIDNKENETVVLFYKNKGIKLEKVELSQECTNVEGSLPTFYLTRGTAEEMRKKVHKRLKELSTKLLGSQGINRSFYTQVLECDEHSFRKHMKNVPEAEQPPPIEDANTHFVVDTGTGKKTNAQPYAPAMNRALQQALQIYEEVATWQFSEMLFRITLDGFDINYGTSRDNAKTRSFLVVTKDSR